MNFVTHNFGKLLHLLDNELNYIIRDFEIYIYIYQLNMACFLTKYIFGYIYTHQCHYLHFVAYNVYFCTIKLIKKIGIVFNLAFMFWFFIIISYFDFGFL